MVWVAINLYVQSSGFRGRLERSLADALGCQIAISRVGFTPWRGISVEGLEATRKSGQQEVLMPLVQANLSFSALFERRFEIRRLVIKEPLLKISTKTAADQTSSSATPSQETGANQQPASEESLPAQVTTKSPESIPRAMPSEPSTAKPWKVVLNVVDIAGGKVEVRDESGHVVILCEGVALRATTTEGANRQGDLSVESVLIHEALRVESVASSFRLTEDRLLLPDVSATLAGGKLEGSLEMAISTEPLSYKANLAMHGCDLKGMLAMAGLPEDHLSGKLDAEAELAGAPGNWGSANGTFRLDIRNGSLRQIGLLQTIGQALGIEELVEFKVEEGYVIGHVREGRTFLDPFSLQSPNFKVLAKGEIQPDASLDLDARLYIHKKIRKRLPSLTKSNLHKSTEAGLEDYQYLEFEITGTLSQPKSNILERMIGHSLEERVRDVLQGLFGD